MAISYPTKPSLGATVNNFPKVQNDKVKEIIDTVNSLTDGTGDASVDALTVAGTATFNGAIVLGDAAADSLTVTGTATYGEPINYDNATTITAFATGGQASATALTAEINNITTVATAGDSVKLPAAVAGKHIYVKNSGATALDIFPATSDSIDALAVNLAIRIQPGSSINFYAKDAIVWESSIDNSITLNSPTTVTGQLEIKATASAGNTVTTITNASQAAARTYTIPDGGASANFVLSEGTATINGAKTFGSVITVPAGAVAAPSIQVGVGENGIYEVSSSQLGVSVSNALATVFDAQGVTSDSFRNRVNLGTAGAGTVTVVEYSNGKDVTTVLTLASFVVGALAGAAAALGVGNRLYTFPAGQHFELVSSLSSIVLTCAGTAVATDTGLGSVIATGAVNVLSGTATFEDRLTGQTINTAAGGGAAVSALTAATAGIGTGISLNVAASVKDVFLNSAGTWNADNTGNLTATGTVVLKWTRMQ